jgi:hypothetical protein
MPSQRDSGPAIARAANKTASSSSDTPAIRFPSRSWRKFVLDGIARHVREVSNKNVNLALNQKCRDWFTFHLEKPSASK